MVDDKQTFEGLHTYFENSICFNINDLLKMLETSKVFCWLFLFVLPRFPIKLGMTKCFILQKVYTI